MSYVYLVRLLDDNSGINNCNFGIFSSKKRAEDEKRTYNDLNDVDNIIIEKFELNVTYKV